MATLGALRVELSANVAKFIADVGAASKSVRQVQRGFERFGRGATQLGQALSVGLTAPLAGIGVTAARSAIAFESAFTGVIKTVDDATDTMGRLTPVGEALQQGFRDLSLEIPIAATALARIGEVAGQLGIESDHILGFTEVMAKLGATTNLSAEEAAQALARLANVTGLPQTEFDRLGSTIVALGNNLATSEAEIVAFGQRIAGAGEIAGLTEPQILAIGAAMSSVGIEAESGGTAVQKVLNQMTQAVAQGGESLEVFARTAGLSSAEFQRAFQEDAGAAFAAFVAGLEQQGNAAFTTLDDLKLGNERVIRAFLSLANAGDLLTDSLALGTDAWAENTALTREAEIRFESTKSQLKLLANNLVDVGITIGEALMPVLRDLAAVGRDHVLPFLRRASQWFADLPSPVKTVTVGLVGLTAALGPLLYALGSLATAVGALTPLLFRVGAAGAASAGGATAAAGGLTVLGTAIQFLWRALMGPVGLVLALGAAVTWLIKFTAAQAPAETQLKRLDFRIKHTRERIARLAEAAYVSPTALRDLKALEDRLLAQRDALVAVHPQLEAAAEQTAVVAEQTEAYSDALQAARDEAGRITDATGQQILAARDLGVSMEEVSERFDLSTEALQIYIAELDAAATPVGNLGDGLGRASDEVAALTDNVKTLVDRLRGTGVIQSAQHWAAALDEVGGLTKLTAGETDELTGVLDAALEKYRALGQDAPADLQRLVEQTAAARTAVSTFVDATARLKLAGAAGAVRRHLADTLRAAQFQAPLPATAMAFPAQALLPTVTPRFDFDPDAFRTWQDRVQASFTGFGATIGQTFARALEGGGQWLGAVQSLGTQAGDRLGGLLSTRLTKTLERGTGFLASGLGKMLGKGLGMAIPVIGPVVGQLIGKLFSLGGPSQAELAGRDAWRSYADGLAREANAAQIQEALGAGWANVEDAHAWIVLRDAVTKAGGSAAEADALWQRYVAAIKQGPDAVNAVTAEMDAWREAAGDIAAEQDQLISSLHGLVDAGAAAFDPAQLDPYLAQMEQLGLLTAADAAALRQLADDAHVDHEAMRQAAERYGVELSALGPQFEQARLSDAAAALVRDFDLLTQEGANVNGVLAGMQDEVQALVAQALTAGVAIPAGMQPIIASLIEQERLTDQNGNKLTDMSHLDFADPIAAKFDLLADSIQLLIIALGGPSGLSKAIEDMVGSAELDIQHLAGEWAAMTDEAKAQFGDFASFVEDRALRDLASAAGLNFDDIAAAWAAMTAEQQAAFGDFRTFLQDHELRQMVDDAGLRFDELETRWAAMTDAQRDEIADFRTFVNRQLAKIRDRTVTVTTRHRSEGTPSGVGGAVHAQHGTPFRQFGSGTRAVLHGLERVMTAGEGRGIQAALGSIQLGLGAIADLSGVRALASGGLVTRPTLTMLGERGPEAVIPQHEIAEFGGGRRVEAKLDQLHQDVALLLDEFRHGLDRRRMARAWHQAAAFSS